MNNQVFVLLPSGIVYHWLTSQLPASKHQLASLHMLEFSIRVFNSSHDVTIATVMNSSSQVFCFSFVSCAFVQVSVSTSLLSFLCQLIAFTCLLFAHLLVCLLIPLSSFLYQFIKSESCSENIIFPVFDTVFFNV